MKQNTLDVIHKKSSKLENTYFAIQEFKKRRANEIIAQIAENTRLTDIAVTAYVKINSFKEAVNLAKKAGQTTKVKEICKKAIKYYQKKEGNRSHLCSSVTYFKDILYPNKKKEMITISNSNYYYPQMIGPFGRCTGYYVDYNFSRKMILGEIGRGSFLNAAIMVEQKGWKRKAEQLYKEGYEFFNKQGFFLPAAKIAKRKGWKEKAKDSYAKHVTELDKSGYPEEAAALAETEGLIDLAAQFYIKCKKFEKAAELCEKIGLKELARKEYLNAIEHHKNEGNFHIAAALADRIGLVNDSNDLYAKSIEKFDNDMNEAKEFTLDFFRITNDVFKDQPNKTLQDKKLIKRNEKFIDKLSLGKIKLW